MYECSLIKTDSAALSTFMQQFVEKLWTFVIKTDIFNKAQKKWNLLLTMSNDCGIIIRRSQKGQAQKGPWKLNNEKDGPKYFIWVSFVLNSMQTDN